LKILEFTVRFKVGTKEEEESIAALLGISGSNKDISAYKTVKAVGPVAYTPTSERTKKAAEALSKCTRVGVLRLEVLEVWANAYPHVDIASEIAKCEAWAESKEVRRTKRGWQKALNTWLSKAQDSARGNAYNHVTVTKVAPVIKIDPETDAWIKASV
jgi:hypothetical protein